MSAHKYTVGEQVYFRPAKFRLPAVPQKYMVLKRLPLEGGEITYRIKGSAEQFERVAKESELSRTRYEDGADEKVDTR
jgi:hypothetical protein